MPSPYNCNSIYSYGALVAAPHPWQSPPGFGCASPPNQVIINHCAPATHVAEEAAERVLIGDDDEDNVDGGSNDVVRTMRAVGHVLHAPGADGRGWLQAGDTRALVPFNSDAAHNDGLALSRGDRVEFTHHCRGASAWATDVVAVRPWLCGVVFKLTAAPRQYGFIAHDDHPQNVFFVPQDCAHGQFAALQVGQTVWFQCGANPDPKHRDSKTPKAIRIQLSAPGSSPARAQTRRQGTITRIDLARKHGEIRLDSNYSSGSGEEGDTTVCRFHFARVRHLRLDAGSVGTRVQVELETPSTAHQNCALTAATVFAAPPAPPLAAVTLTTTAAAAECAQPGEYVRPFDQVGGECSDRDDGPHRIGDDWVRGALHPQEESAQLEFKEINAERGDVRAWILQLMPRLVNACINRRVDIDATAGERVCQTLFGVGDDGRILGFRCARALRDEIARDLDGVIRAQLSQVGPAGSLQPSDVQVKFDRVVQRRSNGAYDLVPDVCVMRLLVRSCVDRCPVYAYADQFGNEVAFERMNTSTRALKIGDIVSRTQQWTPMHAASPPTPALRRTRSQCADIGTGLA